MLSDAVDRLLAHIAFALAALATRGLRFLGARAERGRDRARRTPVSQRAPISEGDDGSPVSVHDDTRAGYGSQRSRTARLRLTHAVERAQLRERGPDNADHPAERGQHAPRKKQLHVGLPTSNIGATALAAAPLHVNLGVDFGTSFTKICYRDVATGDSGILCVGGDCFVPSVVEVGDRGVLSAGKWRLTRFPVRYLKMQLAGEGWPTAAIPGVDLKDAMEVRALAAYFLGNVIRQAKKAFVTQRKTLAEGREITWSANVGVPVEQYDSSTIRVFRDVLRSAWRWVEADQLPKTIDEAVHHYTEMESKENENPSDASQPDCHAVPEIVAGVQSFITSRDARPGRYAYFDIGGGTLDGVLLGYNRYEGSPRIHCYAAKVESLGVASLAYRAFGAKGHNMEGAIAAPALRSDVRDRLMPYENDVQTLVAQIVVDGWCNRDPGALSSVYQDELPVFVGGGGAQSGWYRRTILSTYGSRQQRNVGIPPYHIREVPRPTDLNMDDSNGAPFSRFAVAYGLSVPFEEIARFDLPGSSRPRTRDEAEKTRGDDVIPFERYGAVYG